MERELPPKPEPMAAQPTATSDAPPSKVEPSPGEPTKARIVQRNLSPAEKAAVNERQNALNDLAAITQQQMAVLGLQMNGPTPVLLALLYTQVRQLQAMFDGMCDLLMTAPMLISVPNPDPEKAAANLEPQIGVGPVNFINYFKACTLKAEQQVSMIQRQILSAGGAVPPHGSKGQ
jgi:hypothetical protein